MLKRKTDTPESKEFWDRVDESARKAGYTRLSNRRPGGISWDDMIHTLACYSAVAVGTALEECGEDPSEGAAYVDPGDIRNIVKQALEDHGIDPDALHD